MTNEYHIDGWSFDKRVSIGHLISIGSVIALMIAWWFQVEGRIERSEIRIAVLEQSISESQTRLALQNNDIIRRLEVLDDRMISHLNRHADKQ
jgi:hypothetical protein